MAWQTAETAVVEERRNKKAQTLFMGYLCKIPKKRIKATVILSSPICWSLMNRSEYQNVVFTTTEICLLVTSVDKVQMQRSCDPNGLTFSSRRDAQRWLYGFCYKAVWSRRHSFCCASNSKDANREISIHLRTASLSYFPLTFNLIDRSSRTFKCDGDATDSTRDVIKNREIGFLP